MMPGTRGLAEWKREKRKGRGMGEIRGKLGTVAHTFKPSTQEAEVAGKSLSFRPAWSTEQIGTARAT